MFAPTLFDQSRAYLTSGPRLDHLLACKEAITAGTPITFLDRVYEFEQPRWYTHFNGYVIAPSDWKN